MPDEPVTPTDIQPDIESYIDFFTEVAETREDPLKAGEEFEGLSSYYRALGICRLSAEADVDAFFNCLIQSALTRRFYLEAAQKAGGGPPHHNRASFLEPVFDAMAARQWRLAAELFALASPEWLEGEEYEEDFCYAAFVRSALLDPKADLAPLLKRWKGALEGGKDPRLAVARSLGADDAGAAADALQALLAAQDAKAKEMIDPDTSSVLADELPFYPNHWISVEALALLALAERRGLDVQGPFRGCPDQARAGVFGPFHSPGFPHVRHNNE